MTFMRCELCGCEDPDCVWSFPSLGFVRCEGACCRPIPEPDESVFGTPEQVALIKKQMEAGLPVLDSKTWVSDPDTEHLTIRPGRWVATKQAES